MNPVRSTQRYFKKTSNIYPQGGGKHQGKNHNGRPERKPEILELSSGFSPVNPHKQRITNGVIWNGGNSLEWQIAKSRFIQEFQKFNIPQTFYDVTNLNGEPNELGIWPPGPDFFIEEEPREIDNVQNILLQRNLKNIEIRDAKVALFEESQLPNEKKQEARLAAFKDFLTEQMNIQSSEATLRTQYRQLVSQWETRKRDHTKIREKFAKILESDLGEAAKSQVRVFFQQGQYSRAWKKLNDFYGQRNDTHKSTGFVGILSELFYDSKNQTFAEFNDRIESLFNYGEETGIMRLPDLEKANTFLHAILKGTCKFLKNEAEYCKRAQFDYNTCKQRLSKEMAEWTSAIKHDEQNKHQRYTVQMQEKLASNVQVKKVIKCWICGEDHYAREHNKFHPAKDGAKEVNNSSTDYGKNKHKNNHNQYSNQKRNDRSDENATSLTSLAKKNMNVNSARNRIVRFTNANDHENDDEDNDELSVSMICVEEDTQMHTECTHSNVQRLRDIKVNDISNHGDGIVDDTDLVMDESNKTSSSIATNDDRKERLMKFSTKKRIISDTDINAVGMSSTENLFEKGCRYILDSGANGHLTPWLNHLENYQEKRSKIRFPNDTFCYSWGSGEILGIDNIQWTPEIREGIISVGVLDSLGWSGNIKDGKYYLRDNNDNLRILGKRYNGIYYIERIFPVLNRELKISLVQCNSEDLQGKVNIKGSAPIQKKSTILGLNKLEELHIKFNHIRPEIIKTGIKNKTLNGTGVEYEEIKDLKMRACPDCMRGKMTQEPITTDEVDDLSNIDHGPMGILHIDEKGPMPVKSRNKNKYFDLYVFQPSKYVIAMFKKNKNEFLSQIPEVMNEVKILGHLAGRDYNVRIIQTDRGSIYMDLKAQEWANEYEIRWRASPPYKHQANGTAERMIRTICDKATILMLVYNTPLIFWEDAVKQAIYVWNRTPRLDKKYYGLTPYQIVTGRVPDISHFVPFYAPCMYHVTKEERKILNNPDKAREGRILGYDEKGKNTLLIWDPERKRVLSRRDVVTDQSRDWENQELEIDLLRNYENLLKDQISTPITMNERKNFFYDEDVYEEGKLFDKIQDESKDIEEDEEEVNTIYNRGYQKYYIDINLSFNLPDIPRTLDEALDGKDSDKWKEAIIKEIQQLEEKGTFEIIEWNDKNAKSAAKSKFVFDIKYDADMSIRWKARLVLCGYSQIKGYNYNITYAPTIKKGTIVVVLHIGTIKYYIKVLLDIGGAFAESSNDYDNIDMLLPRRVFGKRIVRVLNSLYGEKQAAYLWFNTLLQILRILECIELVADQCVFVKKHKDGNIYMILMVFVDDIMILGETKEDIEQFIREFQQYVMKTTVYNDVKKYLGMEFRYISETNNLILHQNEYISTTYKDIIIDNNGTNFNSKRNTIKKIPMSPQYGSDWSDDIDEINELYSTIKLKSEQENKLLPAIGTLRYVCDNTRADILSAVGIASIGSNKPEKKNYTAVKQIFDYLNETRNLGIKIGGTDTDITLFGFCDASLKYRRLGGCLYIGLNSGAFETFSIREDTISHSSTEAEIKALHKLMMKILYYRGLLKEVGYKQEKPTKIFIDSKSAKEICEAFMTTKNTQHMNRKIQSIRQQINKRTIQLIFINSEWNVADMLTKPLGNELFLKHREKITNGIDAKYMKELLKNNKTIFHNEENNSNSITIEVY